MRTAYIYALCEPDSRTVRYIGKTGNLARRFQQHVCLSSKKKTHLGHWLKSVLDAGKSPNLVVLCETTEDFWQDEEIRYIAAARAIGIRLTNATDGGEEITMTLETRAKISAAKRGRKHSAESRAKMSESKRGNKHTLGHKHSPEHRAKNSAAKRGRKLSLEHRAKLSEGLRGNKNTLGYKHSAESRANMSAAHREPSPETRAKLSAAKRGNKYMLGHKQSAETIAKRVAKNTGQKRSLEARAKMSAAQKGRWLREREIKAK